MHSIYFGPQLNHNDSNPSTEIPPSRRAKIAAGTDVLVVGGGPATLGAALGAARCEAEVVLVERYGFLGNATAALVMTVMLP